MSGTPQRILDYLRSREAASAIELSQALSLTIPDIRYHLSALRDQGLVNEAGRRPASGRGRPTTLYCLGQNALPDNIPSLAGALLADLIETTADRRLLERHLRNIAGHLSGVKTTEKKLSLSRSLTKAISQLNKMAYEARWEARSSGPLIYLDRCPYGALQRSYNRELCRLDQYILEALIGYPVQRKSGPGSSHCVFAVQP